MAHVDARHQGQPQPDRAVVFGLWRGREDDGVTLQQALREEWSEREGGCSDRS